MFCRKCGQKIDDDSRFCDKCGFPVGQPVASYPDTGSEKKKKRGNGLLLGISIPFIIIAVFMSFICFKIDQDPDFLHDLLSKVEEKNPESDDSRAKVSSSDKGGGTKEHRTSSAPMPDDLPGGTTPPDILEEMNKEVQEYHEELKNEDSDIEGWSAYDKYAKGLIIANGSDTDGDGLTDKEEIEKYGSDPLKVSTADDLYSDGYKAENGMDLFEYAEYDGPTEMTDPTEAVSIYMKTPNDFNAFILDRTVDYVWNEDERILTMAPETFYLAIQIGGYEGDTITVDLDRISDSVGMPPSALDVVLTSSSNCDYDVERSGDFVTITLPDIVDTPQNIGGGKNYNVFVTDKENGSDQGDSADTYGDEEEWDDDWDEGRQFQGSSGNDDFYLEKFFGMVVLTDDGEIARELEPGQKYPGLRLVYFDNATDEEKQVLLCAGEYMYYLNRNEVIQLEENDLLFFPASAIKNEEFKADPRESILKFIGLGHTGTLLGPDFTGGSLPKQKNTGKTVDAAYVWLSTDFYNNAALRKYMNELRGHIKPKGTHFTLKDEFSFKNDFDEFTAGEYKIEGGLCAGLAQIVAEVYNRGSVQNPQGSYHSSEYTYDLVYDITKYDELKTFLDPELSDYKLDLDDRSEADNALLSMFWYYWKTANEQYYYYKYYDTYVLNAANETYLDWQTVENAVDYLDNDQILTWGLCYGNERNRGHRVNLVSYERDYQYYAGEKYDTVAFSVYDNNFPQKYGRLRCIRIPVKNDPGRFVVYYEYVINDRCYSSFYGESYQFSVEDGATEVKFAIFNDEGECLNVRY